MAMDKTYPSALVAEIQATDTADIFAAILRERFHQDRKYGAPIDGGKGGHDLGAWLIIIEAELYEAKKAVIHGGSQSALGRDSTRAEIVQIAAVCVAALQQHGVTE